ncbi:RNA polymerase sporulation sigma factor SigK [Massilibacterium senegalense]|uniref:RNA polymerase sporulation sigma factor SigK n=1 Tax=Massilibacterium senegalense TaxID=1632858 RepID=UPI00078248AE|nr:RNA polymerase sporulation sigma factor SigK [Massilibacterium senegalense]
MSGIVAFMTYILKEVMVFVSYVKHNAFPQPLPSHEEKKYIDEMLKGNVAARNKLIEHNLRLVAHIVKKFDNTKEDKEDLISIGTIGLIKAIESYTPGKGTKLATYASRCIENEILMCLRATKKTKKDISIHDRIGQDKEGNEITLMEVLKNDEVDIVEKLQQHFDQEKVYRFLNILDKREQLVIIERFGLHDKKEKTQREIAKQLGISRSYVSRIEKRALTKLFHAFYKEKQQSK